MPVLLPDVATWVVPTALGILALLLSAALVALVRRRRLAELAALPHVDDLEPLAAAGSPLAPVGREAAVIQGPADVLPRTLPEWDQQPHHPPTWDQHRVATPPQYDAEPVPAPVSAAAVEAPAPPAAAPPELSPEPAPAPVATQAGPPTAYSALSRDLAAAGDAHGAVLAQWAADLQVLRPALGDHGPELAAAVDAVRHEHPVAALRSCRESALGLVRAAGPVRALLAPLDHLDPLAGAAPGRVPDVLPPALVALLPDEQRARLAVTGPVAR